jgi:hypothetical protein
MRKEEKRKRKEEERELRKDGEVGGGDKESWCVGFVQGFAKLQRHSQQGFFNMIAVAGGGTNAMGVSKNVRARRCTRCPARLQVCCPY